MKKTPKPSALDGGSESSSSRKGKGDGPTSPPLTIPTVEVVAAALRDLLDLGIQCLDPESHGAPPYLKRDYTALQKVIELLEKHRDVIPRHRQGRKNFSYSRLQLGRVRTAFDSICTDAAKQPLGPDRDKELVKRLFQEPEYPRCMTVTEELVREAVGAARKEGEDRISAEPGLSLDWLTSFDDWKTAMNGGAKILEEVVKRTSKELPGSASSTNNYSIVAKERGDWMEARYVSEAERLTFLAALLGSKREDAPWVGYVLSVFLADPNTSRRFLQQHELRVPWERPASPGRFGPLDDDVRDAIRSWFKDAVTRSLTGPEDPPDVMLDLLAKRFLPGPWETQEE